MEATISGCLDAPRTLLASGVIKPRPGWVGCPMAMSDLAAKSAHLASGKHLLVSPGRPRRQSADEVWSDI